MDLRSVTVWFAEFADEEQLYAYLADSFAEDMGQPEVDPDRLEWSWHAEPSADPAVLLEGHTGAPVYLEAVGAQWNRAFAATAVILVFNDAIAVPRSVLAVDHAVQLVGRFGEPQN